MNYRAVFLASVVLSYVLVTGTGSADPRLEDVFLQEQEPQNPAQNGEWGTWMHKGVDLVALGKPVLAMEKGEVLAVGKAEKGGRYVILQHAKSVMSGYYRLAAVYVQEGQPVEEGETIGSTLIPSFPYQQEHLHFEVWVKDDPVDPLQYIKEHSKHESEVEQVEEVIFGSKKDSLPDKNRMPQSAKTIEMVSVSPSGSRLAYVVQELLENGEVRQEIELHTSNQQDRVLITWKELESVNSAYGARVIRMDWSPSERFLSFSVHDNDVLVISVVYDLENGRGDTLEPDQAHENGSCCALWHPSKDLLFFRADNETGAAASFYSYDPVMRKKYRARVTERVLGYHPVKDGLSLVVKEAFSPAEILTILPYSSFQ